MKFGQIIRETRERKKITLKSAAEAIGVSTTYLSKIERGLDNPPSDEKIERLSLFLLIQTDRLFGLAGRVPPDVREIMVLDPIYYFNLIRERRFQRLKKRGKGKKK